MRVTWDTKSCNGAGTVSLVVSQLPGNPFARARYIAALQAAVDDVNERFSNRPPRLIPVAGTAI